MGGGEAQSGTSSTFVHFVRMSGRRLPIDFWIWVIIAGLIAILAVFALAPPEPTYAPLTHRAVDVG